MAEKQPRKSLLEGQTLKHRIGVGAGLAPPRVSQGVPTVPIDPEHLTSLGTVVGKWQEGTTRAEIDLHIAVVL